MPNFYPRAHARQMPLTPPEYIPAYNGGGCLYQAPSLTRSELYGYDAADPYKQSRGLPPPSYLTPGTQQVPYSGLPPPGLTHPGQVYHPAAAPTLPPIRQYVDDAQVQRQQHQQQQQDQRNRQANAKTEKPVGGVAAVLDYEMDVMVDFVSEMAQGMYAFYVSPICIADIDL